MSSKRKNGKRLLSMVLSILMVSSLASTGGMSVSATEMVDNVSVFESHECQHGAIEQSGEVYSAETDAEISTDTENPPYYYDYHTIERGVDNGDGTHTVTCADCGIEFTDAHFYGDYEESGDNEHTRSCLYCTAKETKEHNFGEYTNNEDGTHSRYCLDCDAEKTVEHRYSDTDGGHASNNGDGTHTFTCLDCEAEDIEDHSYNLYDNGDGTHRCLCEQCFYSYNEPHNFNEDGICDDCGAKESVDTKDEPDTNDQPDTVTCLYGDVNNDGRVTALDAYLLQRTVVGYDTLSEFKKLIGDVNGDGRINSIDCLDILRKVVGYSSDYMTGQEVEVLEELLKAV